MVSKKLVLELKQKLERKLAAAIAARQKTGYADEYVEKSVAIKEQIMLLDELLGKG
ncbi:MAG: hypothetical protein QW719_02840 [Candidatus Micrarchaeaceae archaeon]